MGDSPILFIKAGFADEIRAAITATTMTPDGQFVIYRRVRRGYSRAGMPRFRHQTLESAETEAFRLSQKHPESTFVILQEVAMVGAQP